MNALRRLAPDVVPLLLRLLAGGFMAFLHGWPKLQTYAERKGSFPDPLGVGTSASLALTVFAEVVCAVLVLTGTFTRVAALPLVFAMAVAAFVIHGDDPLGKKELALVYLTLSVAVVFAGPGRFSVDARFFPGRFWA